MRLTLGGEGALRGAKKEVPNSAPSSKGGEDIDEVELGDAASS